MTTQSNDADEFHRAVLITSRALKNIEQYLENDKDRKALLETAKLLKLARDANEESFGHADANGDITSDEMILDISALSKVDFDNLKHIAKVDATIDAWHDGFSCEPNTNYSVTCEFNSVWTLGRRGQPPDTWEFGARRSDPIIIRDCTETPHGLPEMDSDGNQVGSRRIFLGYPWVLIWHHQPSEPHIAELRDLRAGATSVVIGPDGGSMHFYIPDVSGAYGDNDGHCLVYVREV